MGNFLNWNFWFDSRPDYFQSNSQNALFVLIGVFLLLWAGTWLWSKKKNVNRKVLDSFSSFGFANAIIGFFIWFFGYERVPFLSARLWYIFWVVSMIVWMYFIYRRYKKIQGLKEKTAKEQELKKYIP